MGDKTSPSNVIPASVPAQIALLPALTAGLFDDVSRDRMSAGKHRWKSLYLTVLKESVPVQRSAYWRHKLVLRAVLLVAVYSLLTLAAMAQKPVGKAGKPQKLTVPAKEELSSAPAKVEVSPVARDEEIIKRLQSILRATNWFTDPQVRVEEGVVFLHGQVESEELKNWAGDLARNTQTSSPWSTGWRCSSRRYGISALTVRG
jgi:hypothetical protein